MDIRGWDPSSQTKIRDGLIIRHSMTARQIRKKARAPHSAWLESSLPEKTLSCVCGHGLSRVKRQARAQNFGSLGGLTDHLFKSGCRVSFEFHDIPWPCANGYCLSPKKVGRTHIIISNRLKSGWARKEPLPEKATSNQGGPTLRFEKNKTLKPPSL